MKIGRLIAALFATTVIVAPIALKPTAVAADGLPIEDFIYDPALVEYIKANLDVDGDGCISVQERLMPTQIIIRDKVVHDLTGLDMYMNLTNIDIKTDISELDFAKFTNLEYLTIDGTNNVDDVDISFNKKLEAAEFKNCNFDSVNIARCDALRSVTYDGDIYYPITATNFPDEVLRSEIVDADIDDDNLLSASEVEDVTYFVPASHGGSYVHSIKGLELFPNLAVINMKYDGRSSVQSDEVIILDLSVLPNLESVDIQDKNSIDVVILTKNPSDPNYTPSKLKSFAWFDGGNGPLGVLVGPELDFSDCPDITSIVLGNVDVCSLDLRKCTKLEEFSCYHSYLSGLALPATDTLKRVHTHYTWLETVDISRCPNVVILEAYYSELRNLIIGENSNLTYVDIQGSDIGTLDVSGCPNLETLQIEGTAIRSIDICNNPKLIDVYTLGERQDGLVDDCESPDLPMESCYRYVYQPRVDDDWKWVFGVDPDMVVNTVKPAAPSTPVSPAPSVPSTPSTPSTPSAPAASTTEGGVAGFVERLYTVALGRASDANGKAAWINAIRNGESGAEAAKGFLFSDEFMNKNMSNGDFVTTLYRVFFDRQPDAAGHAAWVAALERGESKQDVIMGFINSTEWANVCVKYGIRSGGTGTANITIEPNDQVIAFATRLYTTCLKRTPDQNGLRAWALQLANLRDTGTNAAHGFFFSDEMNNAGISNEEFVTRLYLTFMDRNPDQAGFNAWVGQLNSGVSREEVFQGFAQSTEFGTICANYGIIR